MNQGENLVTVLSHWKGRKASIDKVTANRESPWSWEDGRITRISCHIRSLLGKGKVSSYSLNKESQRDGWARERLNIQAQWLWLLISYQTDALQFLFNHYKNIRIKQQPDLNFILISISFSIQML